MMVVSAFVAAALALLGAAQAVDIDNGFTQDGSTTYCMGVNGSVGTLNFDSLEASNVGRCPVGVTLTLTASEFHVSDLVTVKWSAKANAGLANAIFPNAIDAITGLPAAVTTSSLFACTFGTNCATNVGGTPTGADGTNSGAFATDGTKALETNTFNLATAGDYIIVGLVALPGDASLNLAAEEYIVFKKISVVSADSTISSSSTSNTGSSASSSGSTNTATRAPGSTSGNDSGSSAEQESKQKQRSGTDDSAQVSDSSTMTTTSAPTTSGDTTQQTDAGSSGSVKSASTSSGSSDFFGENGVIIIAALVGCCIVGVVGFAFVMRRRKEQRMHANKAFDLNSPSMDSDMDDSGLNGGKIDLTYVANISARNNDKAAENMMSEESSVAIMASAERGSELNSSNGSSMHSLPKSSLDTDEYSEKASYGAVGAAAHSNEAEIDAYRMSNMSDLSSIAGGTQSEASMSNFGDSVVSARQNKYLQPGDWNDSESSRMDSRLDSMEQAELKARGFGSIGGFSTVSGLSVDDTSRITGLSEHDSNRDIGFSMSSRPTVESRFTEDSNVMEDRATVESRFDDYRATEESRVTEDSRATGFSEAMDHSRLQSEVSVDSYGFRASRSSADSYSSGMSPYSRESSRISGFSVASSLDDRSSNASNY
ncbi:hypothetical protein PC129_g4208 [Phytophthora cactorum]|uniref:Uncharacterized protein n=1 Tax=Phytophthora cactorum TaxID=29920 RepID=A0A329SGE2_9STRA|nr:hypothetical protein Pcac1_g1583 [Phytophthora cactorum]KAG2837496.1 hypothetical protein PC111_g4619 [Phytophthora cactorum]KAG2847335.1 hypothetical protein PC112_g1108 [Phytophthora cactorum]KAG2863011.1 hypothetical protein PC113_g5801 [Phytophthora cactorum]KAG2920229.1 hypothetical protein PC114_g6163 [Phytophthora cactorum]